MKKWLSLVAVVVLCLALVIGVACGGGEGEEGVKEVKYGVGTPLTGVYGTVVGLPAMHAQELASEKLGEFEVAGQTYRWKYIYEDNAWTGAGGVATATKFIYEDGVKFMSQGGADPAGAAQTICEEAGVLMFTATCPPQLLGPDKPHTFHTSANLIIDTAALFQYVTETYPEVKTVAIANADNAFGHAVGQAGIDAAPLFGLEVVTVDWVPAGVTELYPTATKLVDINPDLIFCDMIVLKPMREMGYEGKGAYISWGGEPWLEYLTEEYAQGYIIYEPNPFGANLPQELRDFFDEIEERYGDAPQHPSYITAVLADLFTQVLQKAGTVDDVDKIMETMWSEVYFDTPIGPMRYGGEELIGINNILLWPAYIYEIRGSECALVFDMSPDEAYELACEAYGDLYLPK